MPSRKQEVLHSTRNVFRQPSWRHISQNQNSKKKKRKTKQKIIDIFSYLLGDKTASWPLNGRSNSPIRFIFIYGACSNRYYPDNNRKYVFKAELGKTEFLRCLCWWSRRNGHKVADAKKKVMRQLGPALHQLIHSLHSLKASKSIPSIELIAPK